MAPRETRKRFLRAPQLDVHTEHGNIRVELRINGEHFRLSTERAQGKWLVYWDAPLELCNDDIYTVADKKEES